MGREKLDTWDMERVRDPTLRPGTSSLLPGLMRDVCLGNTIGSASLTSFGNLLCQKIGNRILLLTIDDMEISLFSYLKLVYPFILISVLVSEAPVPSDVVFLLLFG